MSASTGAPQPGAGGASAQKQASQDETSTLHLSPPPQKPADHSNNLDVPASPLSYMPGLAQIETRMTDGQTSISRQREQMYRQEDSIELMKAERLASKRSSETAGLQRGKSTRRDGEREPEPVDDFNDTSPVHKGSNWKPPEEPATRVAKVFKKVHDSSVFIRYFTYIVPVAVILIIPLVLGVVKFRKAQVGGVHLKWFTVWLEVIWLSLWGGRMVAKMLPYPVGIIASICTNGYRKWKDMAQMLEVPITLFIWWLSIYVSFLPIMTNNHVNGNPAKKDWEKSTSTVLLCLFIGTIINLVEKIIIQLIAISFHERTYEARTELNKLHIRCLTKLYRHAKDTKLDMEKEKVPSGAMTPQVALAKAGHGAQHLINRLGDVFGKVAGDFTGKEVNPSTSPQQVVLTLLQTTEGSNVLARQIYRTLVRPDAEHVTMEDMRVVFEDEDELDVAFSMFDRDMNGDISCEEMELACVEIGRERKTITASLKDLDSVIGKLDNCLMFVVLIILILVFLALVSKSTASVLGSASSTILALSWLFSASAQELLASLIFVFVKHPFDVGDRVDIYNTGAGTVDTFVVKEISLMYTEFRRLEGHIVQAPNSLLNTLFILNMRRSGSIAEPVPIVCKFGTTIEQIDTLRERMLEFVTTEKREYLGKIITELKDLPDMHSIKVNVVFFHKTNWQNELVRLNRRNRFMCTLMEHVIDLGIEGPNMRWPGQKQSAPVFLQHISPEAPAAALDGTSQPPMPDPPAHSGSSIHSGGFSAASRKADFSLGAKDMISEEHDDIFDDRARGIRSRSASRMARLVEEESNDPASTRSGSNNCGVGRSHSHSLTPGFLRRRRTDSSGNKFGRYRRHEDEELGELPSRPSESSMVRPSMQSEHCLSPHPPEQYQHEHVRIPPQAATAKGE